MRVTVKNIKDSKVIINGKNSSTEVNNYRLKDIWYYIQGNVRYKLFYSKLYILFRFHIFDQICERIASMDMTCYTEGQCKLCGCKTTALQMSNKACDKPCYPRMMNKKEWKRMKEDATYVVDGFTYNGTKFVKK